MSQVVEMLKQYSHIELIDVVQADQIGCHYTISATNDIVKKSVTTQRDF